ncbi:MAG TPA: DUF2510 domain-containing protein [Lacisediminihabitans sp.]|uniref:DUF2510 domain-containing protein n=1 Tax=Lacisediminihabitans sp. TaxID=2787631 RepID=UPI002EDA7D55
MTDDAGSATPVPGWYPDYTGLPRLRWWDGTGWTEHLHDPALATPGLAARPALRPGTPVYTVFLWVILGLQLVSVITLSTLDLNGLVTRTATDSTMGGSMTMTTLSPGYLLTSLVGYLAWGLGVLLAYFDWRRLRNTGFDRPFHWAFTFINSGVYIIGRSVIVKRRAGRGLLPIWIWALIVVVSIVVLVVKVTAAVSVLTTTPGIPA